MRVAITREQSELSSLAEMIADDGIEIVPWPLISTHAIPFSWPDNLDTASIDWLIFSSRNGVRFFLDRLNELGVSLHDKTRIAAVGNKTAISLRERSLDVAFLPDTSNGETMFRQLVSSRIAEGEKVVYARAARVNFDPTVLMNEAAIDYIPIVCYETTPEPLGSDVVGMVSENDWALFTSPSAVESFHRQHGRPGARLIAIGPTTEAAMKQAGWSGVTVMKEPDLNMIAEYL